MTIKSFWQLWQHFWFEPQSVIPIALFRILFSIMLLDTAWHLSADWLLYYGNNALFPIQSIAESYLWNKDPRLDLLLLLPPGDGWVWAFLGLYVTAIVFMILGLFTRVSTIVVLLCLISLHHHTGGYNMNGGDNFEVVMTILLAVSPAGNALSLDNLLRCRKQDWRITGFEPQKVPGWNLRLLQLQFCICYCHTFFCKLGGDFWVNGFACYVCTRFNDFRRFPMPDMFDNIVVYRILTYGTLFVEGTLWWMVWFKELRYWILLLGLCFHLGIELLMNIPAFEGLFMSMYILFIDPEDLRKCMNWIKSFITRKTGAPSVVAFDGNCMFCVRCSGILQRLDTFGRLRFVDFRSDSDMPGIDLQRAEKEMLVKTKNACLGGFEAFRFMAARLPMLWPFVPFMYLPGASVIGKQVYSTIASRRNLLVGESCQGNLCHQVR